MFEVTSTGMNKYYGKKDERIKIADNHILIAIKNHWISSVNIKYLEGRFHRNEAIKEKKVAIMPEKKIYLLNELKFQSNVLERIQIELQKLKKRDVQIKGLLKGVRNNQNA